MVVYQVNDLSDSSDEKKCSTTTKDENKRSYCSKEFNNVKDLVNHIKIKHLVSV